MGGSLLYLRGTTQGHERGEGKSKPEMGLRGLGQGSWIRAWNGEGQAGSRCGVPKMETKVVEGQDMQWKILERARAVGTRGSEFRCYMECNNIIATIFSYSTNVYIFVFPKHYVTYCPIIFKFFLYMFGFGTLFKQSLTLC